MDTLMETVQGQKILKRGYTTGTCAALASRFSVEMAFKSILFNNKEDTEFEKKCFAEIKTPKGIILTIPVYNKSQEFIEIENDSIFMVKKYSGDDPDVTNGIEIYSKASLIFVDKLQQMEEQNKKISTKNIPYPYEHKVSTSYGDLKLHITGGKGVGFVTRDGLACEKGKSAINPVPRNMIKDESANAIEKLGRYIQKSRNVENIEKLKEIIKNSIIKIEIIIPEGEEIAKKTFNKKLGIQNGISILGTSGIVEPMSEKALVDTIKTEINQFANTNKGPMLVCPGNYGQEYAKEALGIDLENGVKCSNFIGEMLDYSVYRKISKILLIGHGGKLIKLAAGVMNTHSSYADSRQETVASHGALQGLDTNKLSKIMNAVSIEEMVDILGEKKEDTMNSIGIKIKEHIDHRTRNKIQVEYIVFTKKHGTLIMSENAMEFIKELKCQEYYME